MNLGDKAEQADQEEVRLARDSNGVYRLEDEELVPADDLGSEDFPQFGDFARTTNVQLVQGEPQLGDEVFVEVPSALAEILVDMEIGTGDYFRIQAVRKNSAGEWEYSVTDPDRTPDE